MNLSLDLRFAMRSALRHPTFSIVVIVTLALGIGANTAMFSLMHAVFLKPLPFQDPERIVFASTTFNGERNPGSSAPDYFDFREQTDGLETLSAVAWGSGKVTVTGGPQPEMVTATQITPDLAQTLGIPPAAGRWFSKAEGEAGAPVTLMLNPECAQNRFGGVREALGKTLTVNGTAGTVVGVLPREFRYISEAGIVIAYRRGDDTMAQPRRFHNLLLMGRLKPGATLAQVQRQADVISGRLQQAYPESNKNKALLLEPLQTALVGDQKSRLILLMASVGMVLLIACGNVAGLFLARGCARRCEIAIRCAIGASRSRIISQLLIESVSLSLAAGVLGIFVASLLEQVLPEVTGLGAMASETSALDGRVLAFTAALSILTGMVFGIVPAFRAASPDLARDLVAGARASETRGGLRLRGALVVSQVFISFALLVGSGLLIRSFIRLNAIDPGFDTEDLLTGEIMIPRGRFSDPVHRARFFETLRGDFAAVPGVKAVGFINNLPIRNSGNNVPVWAPDRPPRSSTDWQMAFQRSVLPGYFEAMRIPLLAGRDISSQDMATSPKVLVASSQMARTLFPGKNALGQAVMVDAGGEQPQPFVIIGIVADVRGGDGLSRPPRMMMYRSLHQVPSPVMRFAIRTGLDPDSLTQTIRKLALARDPDIPVQDLQSMEQLISTALSTRRATVVTLTIFSVVSLMLASIGLYGVMAYYVAQRTFEIGLRMSLGADARQIMKLVFGRAAVMVSIGLLIGLAGALAGSRLIRELLYETTPTDATTIAVVGVCLAAVCFAASAAPAWRASRIQPMQALHNE